MQLLHPRFRVVYRHQIHGVILVAILTLALVATVNAYRVDASFADPENVSSEPSARPTAMATARKLAAAQAHMLAARSSEASMIQRQGRMEDRLRWERSLASAIRALRSIESGHGGSQLAFHVGMALLHLEDYGHHVEATMATREAHARTSVPSGLSEAANRFEAAYQATAAMSSLITEPSASAGFATLALNSATAQAAVLR